MSNQCGAMHGEMLCGLPAGHQPKNEHRDGVAIWKDGDPLPPRTEHHEIGAGGYCYKCQRHGCLDDIEVDDEELEEMSLPFGHLEFED